MELQHLQHLYYFVTVIDHSTFTAAAEKVHISQPSLSTSIKKLEKELGFTLLDRSKRELKLTKEGKILYQEAKKLLIHFDHVSDEMNRLKKEGPLELSVGIIESSKFWVPKVLTKFTGEYADVYIRLLDVLSFKDVENALKNFDIHLAITNQYINNDSIKTIPLYDERLVALLPPSHPLKYKSFITIQDLKNEKLIISKEGFQTREDILNAFRKGGIKPNIHFEIGRFETACDLVEEGLGVTVAPENYVKHMGRTNFHFKRIHDSNISRTVYLAFDTNRYLPPLVDQFILLVKTYFNK
ncbi:LysR family transcriptional regulator [Virgibacillus necropolis]|uniref:Transcriptional regulator n=1 Tax=Virgibacillus necropolis TaxID=163877 RepID=A0A221MEX7_9BACI|nr:LysR family transcriptional regulator [Virgibacillus necropolis]ASN06191.1 transcriptional regulator [Virgibacillus necropolis]